MKCGQYAAGMLTVLTAMASASAAELILTEPEKSCTLADIGAGKCLLVLGAKGATYLGVKGRVAEGPAATRLTTNEISVPDGLNAALTVKLADGTFNGAGPYVSTVLIDSRIGTAAQAPKSVKLTIQGTDATFVVFGGKPVTLSFTRKWRAEPESLVRFVMRSAEKIKQPTFVSWEFYRTAGDEQYPLDGTISDPKVEGDATAFPFRAFARLPRGNYNSAAGTLLFQAAGGKEIPVQLLCRIKDDWPMPVAALLAGHLLILLVRRWVGVERPVKVLLLKLLTIGEAVRAFELANPNPSDGDKQRLRQIKTLLADARRNLEQRNLDQAGLQLREGEKLLSEMEGVPGVAGGGLPLKAPPELSGIKWLAAQIRAADVAVEFVALTISLLLGSAMYFDADRFGTYGDYLKLFLFAFGISTSTQGFGSVLEQLKGSKPGATEV